MTALERMASGIADGRVGDDAIGDWRLQRWGSCHRGLAMASLGMGMLVSVQIWWRFDKHNIEYQEW